MFKRLLVALLLLIAAFNATALEYTDVYYYHSSATVNEDGWGVFLVQSDTFIFIAFYIYGPNKQPIWYTAQLTDDSTGKYTGPVYATTGTYFGLPWNPADGTIPPPQVGTATFAPTDIYHATLTYTINGMGPIIKPLVRQTLAPYKMSGNYSGSMAGSIGGMTCDPAVADPSFRAKYGLAVTQTGDTAATLVFTFVDTTHSGLVCTAAGPLTHYGRLYQMGAGTTVACTGPGQDGRARAYTIDSLHPTGQGIEGRLTGDAGGGGCTASLHFSAVLNVNN
jgi:hypothetical protein